jgi:hypothetical protein
MTGNCNKTATTQAFDGKRVVKTPKNAMPDTVIKTGRGAGADARARQEREETPLPGPAAAGRNRHKTPVLLEKAGGPECLTGTT